MSVEFKDYYRILGVPSTATDEEIKQAFRKLAVKHHPDVARDKPAAERMFKEVNEAHEVLSNPESRRKYDELGSSWKAGAPPRPAPGRTGPRYAGHGMGGEDYEFTFEGTGFSDFFEQFFGGRAGRSQGASPFDTYGGAPGATGRTDRVESAQRGQDIQGDILITLPEALRGGDADDFGAANQCPHG
jgi:curved DNA-binding protein